MDLSTLIKSLSGPILVIGASGFVGANLFRALLHERDDVMGSFFSGGSWRLHGLPVGNTVFLNMQDAANVQAVFARVAPKVIFDCSSFGAYSFEQDFERIHATNYLNFIRILEMAAGMDLQAYVHAGSSSEYGTNAAGPSEQAVLLPNSHYAVSKCAAASAIAYYGKQRGVPVANLRLYSVYGPYEDSSRLFPVLCEHLVRGALPPFSRTEVARDFIHTDDVTEAFVRAALRMNAETAGESFNIGTGTQTTLGELAHLAQQQFGIHDEPVFDPGVGRAWDVDAWFADARKAERLLGWKAQTTLSAGLERTCAWWKEQLQKAPLTHFTKKQQAQQRKHSISAIVACYRDAEAIPIMYERLKAVFDKEQIDYEIIFINDCSPDDSQERVLALSAQDPRVIGITHSRNFGSQAAFRSGMELCSKEACVLLDGDLQDPPELITQFIEQWRKGADVVYGRRIQREMPRPLEACYKAFYRVFAAMSEVPMPKNAGDFSLLDRTVIHWILRCGERDSFLRGLRAYVGFTQVGVDYIRPERMFGRSTNNWIKNIGWAKKAIFSFSRLPLHLLTAAGALTCVLTILLGLATLAIKILAPSSVPQGVTFLALLVMFFGSASLFGLGLLGEYIGKILEETKARPPFIRKYLISSGKITAAQHHSEHPRGIGRG